MDKNQSIKCYVSKCAHNLQGCCCSLEQITVSCGESEGCTCCKSFSENCR